MDLSATQAYKDDNFDLTQKILQEEEKEEEAEEPLQVGILSIGSNDYRIKTGTVKIGRHSSCDIVINHVTVSKIHAEIESSGRQGSTWISDLNSSNKTKLNNTELRPTRLYELKDGSVIEFGIIRATYRTHNLADNTVIPETPAPLRHKIANKIIPTTPDSSLTNSSNVDDDSSFVLGTQNDNEDNVFRRPQIPQFQLTNIDKKDIPTNEGDDSRTATLSNINVSKNQVSIFDAETQQVEGYKIASKSIHDLETQEIVTDIPENLVQANVKAGKQMLELNTRDLSNSPIMDIHNIETQSYTNDINEAESGTSKINIQNITKKKLMLQIKTHITKTHSYTDENDTDQSSDGQKSESSKNNDSQKENLAQVGHDIHDLETQKFDMKLNDLETQLDISDMETQLITKKINETNQMNKNKDSILNTENIKNKTNNENNTNSSKSGSSSPRSLNLSSPGVEDCPSSSSNRSDHLLESSLLLEFFADGIDKHDTMQPFNASTPKLLTKVSLKNNSNIENEESNEENDEDIFEAPTQHSRRTLDNLEINKKDEICKDLKKKCEKPRLKHTNDDSETDAEEELIKKQSESLNKSSNEDINNKNNQTSVESEDIFDQVTQRLSDSMNSKNISNSSTNQLQNSNKINKTVDNSESIKIANNVDSENQKDMSEVNEATSAQLILPREVSPETVIDSGLKDISKKNNENFDAVVNVDTEPINCYMVENLDSEDLNYELAPTQVIDEIEKEKEKSSAHEKDFQKNLNDPLEEKLNKIFDNENNDTNKIYELPSMSTQCLENILESSQCDNSINNSIADRDTNNVSRKQLRKKNPTPSNQHSQDLLSVKITLNKLKSDSQNSDIYFSSITTRRKKNILRNSQETEENVLQQDANSSQISKLNNEKVHNTTEEFNKRKTRHSKINKPDEKMETLKNADDKTKNISSSNIRSLRSSQSMKQKDETVSEMSKQILGQDLIDEVKIDDAKKNTSTYTSCSPKDEQCAQTNNPYEIDDDILTRLPAVRISGTLSNPASPSASSTLTTRSRTKQAVTRRNIKRKSLKKESLNRKKNHKQNSRKADKLSVDKDLSSILSTSSISKTSYFEDTSEDSETDNEIKYERFQQLAKRMLGNKYNYLKQQNKKSSTCTLSNTDIQNPIRNSSRMIRHSKQSDKSSHEKKICLSNDKSRELETKSVTKKKILSNTDGSMDQITSKKRKTTQVIEKPTVFTRSRRSTIKNDRQSPNILEYFSKMSSRENSPVIGSTKSLKDNKAISQINKTQDNSLNMETDKNIDPGRSKRFRRMVSDRQIMGHSNEISTIGRGKKNKPGQIKETETHANQPQKVLKIILSPIKNCSDDSSQEVERIMAKSPINAPDINLSIRQSNTAKMFKKELTKRRKRSNSNTDSDSALTDSHISSEIGDSDNTQIDNPMSRAKRGRYVNSSLLSEAQVSTKKETFKKPARIKNSTFQNSSFENTISKDSQDSDSSTTSRISRSKAASLKKKEKMNQSMHKVINEDIAKPNTENISIASTPRTRRSMSILSNSTSPTMRHKILFTGITEDYSMIVKTLGGSKVEDPSKCTVLVTDKVRRTYKFLCALARGLPIVAIDWLKDSEAAARFLDWENYILKDPVAEAKFGFRLRKSLEKAKEKKLLDGYTVILTPNIAPPPIEELKDMISSCGGKALLRPPTKWPENSIILSREEDLPNAKKILVKGPKTITIQSTEFILTGILRQETDFNKYKLI